MVAVRGLPVNADLDASSFNEIDRFKSLKCPKVEAADAMPPLVNAALDLLVSPLTVTTFLLPPPLLSMLPLDF